MITPRPGGRAKRADQANQANQADRADRTKRTGTIRAGKPLAGAIPEVS